MPKTTYTNSNHQKTLTIGFIRSTTRMRGTIESVTLSVPLDAAVLPAAARNFSCQHDASTGLTTGLTKGYASPSTAHLSNTHDTHRCHSHLSLSVHATLILLHPDGPAASATSQSERCCDCGTPLNNIPLLNATGTQQQTVPATLQLLHLLLLLRLCAFHPNTLHLCSSPQTGSLHAVIRQRIPPFPAHIKMDTTASAAAQPPDTHHTL